MDGTKVKSPINKTCIIQIIVDSPTKVVFVYSIRDSNLMH